MINNIIENNHKILENINYFSLDISTLAGVVSMAFTIHYSLGPVIK